MKKITIILVLCLILGALVSCGKTEEANNSGKTEEKNNSSTVFNSSSDVFILTEDKLREVIDNVNNEIILSDVQKGTSLSEDKALPVYMSLENVKKLSTKTFKSSWDELKKHEKRITKEFDSLISELPQKCIMTHRPAWIANFPHEIRQYIVLNPLEISESDNEELVLLLEYLFYELKAESKQLDYDYDKYYKQDMNELYEKYSDIGTVLLKASIKWYLLNVKDKTLEQVEIFDNYTEIVYAYYDIIDGRMAEDYDKIVNENKN